VTESGGGDKKQLISGTRTQRYVCELLS